MRDELEKLAHEIGKMGAAPTESDRLSFEAWMCGHSWEVSGEWTGVSYRHTDETGAYVHGGSMDTRRLFAAWRDRGALDRQLAERADHVPDTGNMVGHQARPTDASIAQAVWRVSEYIDLSGADRRLLQIVVAEAMKDDAERAGRIPAPEVSPPFDRCPKCTAKFPAGMTCGGEFCGLKRCSHPG